MAEEIPVQDAPVPPVDAPAPDASEADTEHAPVPTEEKAPVKAAKAPAKAAKKAKAPAKSAKAPAKAAAAPAKAAQPVGASPSAPLLAFNVWDCSGITVTDEGLKRYITLEPRIVPKTGARYAGNRFHKSRTFIVERLINKLMVVGHKGKKHFISSGHNTGRAAHVYAIVEDAFRIIESRTKKNPVAVFVQALERAAPREEIINIEYGGARYPKAVECAPQRRVDIALRMMAQAAYHRSFNSKKSTAQALAEEILAAAAGNQQSQAIQKKVDLERTADSSR